MWEKRKGALNPLAFSASKFQQNSRACWLITCCQVRVDKKTQKKNPTLEQNSNRAKGGEHLLTTKRPNVTAQ